MTDRRGQDLLPVWMIGRRYWKAGDHDHIWVVDGVEAGKAGQAAYAILVTSDDLNAEDVELSHLENPDLYTPLQAATAKGK